MVEQVNPAACQHTLLENTQSDDGPFIEAAGTTPDIARNKKNGDKETNS